MCKSLPGVIGVKGQEAIKPTVVRVQKNQRFTQEPDDSLLEHHPFARLLGLFGCYWRFLACGSSKGHNEKEMHAGQNIVLCSFSSLYFRWCAGPPV